MHEGHMGIIRTKMLLRRRVWFPGLDQLVEWKIKNCIPCQAVTPLVMQLILNMSELPERHWQKLNTYFYGTLPSGKYVLLFICQYSQHPVTEVVYSTGAEAVIQKLDKVFSEFGLTEEILSDNGSPFQGEEMKQYGFYSGFYHRKITAGEPNINGLLKIFSELLGSVCRQQELKRRLGGKN